MSVIYVPIRPSKSTSEVEEINEKEED